MKNHHKIKLIAASVALMASFGASAGLGGLNVQSRLGEPFSGTITVTGDEAKALLNGGKASISNGSLRAGVRKSGDHAVVSIRSTKPIQDPVLIFQVGVGSQSREYTAIIDPAGYTNKTDGSTRVHANSQINRLEAAPADTAVERKEARERISRAVEGGQAEASADKATPERRVSNESKARKAAKPKAQTQSTIVYGKRHLVLQGETLNSIAARIRPQGMTLAQTVQALVSANPDVFVGNDANRMLAGKVLNIPARSALRAHVGAAKAPAAAEATAPVVPTPDVPATAPVDIAASDEAQAPAQTNTAVTPEQTAPKENVAASAAASAPVEVNASAAASDVAASAQASAAEQVQPTAEPVQEEAVAEAEDSGLLRWLLLGGVGLIALYILSKLLGKRKSAVQEEVAESDAAAVEKVEDEEGITEFKTIPEAEQSFASSALKTTAVVAGTAAAAAAAADVAKKDDELEIEDDFGDDVFFSEVEEAPVTKQGDVDFDLNTIDNSQEAIVSGAVTRDEETEKRRDADWDTIESTESVYEPDPENPYVSQADETAHAETFEAKPQNDSNESWDFSLDEKETEAQTVETVKAEAAEEKAEEWDFFAEESKAEVEAAPAVADVAQKTESQEWDFFTEKSQDEVAQNVEEVIEFVVETPKAEESAISSAAATATAAVVTAASVAASKAFDFESAKAGEDEAPLEFTSVEVEQAPVIKDEAVSQIETVEAVDITADTEAVVEQTEIAAEPELFKIQQAESLAFQDDEDLDAQVTQVAQADEAIEWDNITVADGADSSRRESGFISESVGMTAPLEAKYELAKMYIEIGDPDAARETLAELMEEADGAILSKVKAMLKELDA